MPAFAKRSQIRRSSTSFCLNNDTSVSPELLRHMVEAAESDPAAVVVGAVNFRGIATPPAAGGSTDGLGGTSTCWTSTPWQRLARASDRRWKRWRARACSCARSPQGRGAA